MIQEEEEEEDLVNNLLTIPPGFERGVLFEENNLGSIEDEPKNIQVNKSIVLLAKKNFLMKPCFQVQAIFHSYCFVS